MRHKMCCDPVSAKQVCEDPAPTYMVKYTGLEMEGEVGPFTSVDNAEKCLITLMSRSDTIWARVMPVVEVVDKRVCTIEGRPQYRLTNAEVVFWLFERGDRLWRVDGDPVLGSVLNIPCPTDELVHQIVKVGRDMLIIEPPNFVEASPFSIDQLVDNEGEMGGPTLAIVWDGMKNNQYWLLIEEERDK